MKAHGGAAVAHGDVQGRLFEHRQTAHRIPQSLDACAGHAREEIQPEEVLERERVEGPRERAGETGAGLSRQFETHAAPLRAQYEPAFERHASRTTAASTRLSTDLHGQRDVVHGEPLDSEGLAPFADQTARQRGVPLLRARTDLGRDPEVPRRAIDVRQDVVRLRERQTGWCREAQGQGSLRAGVDTHPRRQTFET